MSERSLLYQIETWGTSFNSFEFPVWYDLHVLSVGTFNPISNQN